MKNLYLNFLIISKRSFIIKFKLMQSFKEKPFQERLKNSAKYLEKYPDKVPIILYAHSKNENDLIKRLSLISFQDL